LIALFGGRRLKCHLLPLSSVENRIRCLNLDVVTPDKTEACRAVLGELTRRAESDRKAIVNLLDQTFRESEHSSDLALNSVRLALQNKVVEWDGEFAAFEQKWLPSEKDVRRLASHQLKRLFSDSSVPTSPEIRPSPTSALPSLELDEKQLPSDSSSGASSSSLAARRGESLPALSQENLDRIDAGLSGLGLGPQFLSGPSSISSSALPSPALTPRENAGNESDSTVCAPETFSRPSPRRIFSQTHDSGVDSEEGRLSTFGSPGSKGTVAGLVHKFDANEPNSTQSISIPKASSSTAKEGRLSPLRPPLRRGRTEGISRIAKPVASTSDVLSDGADDSSVSRRRPTSRAPDRSIRLTDRPSLRREEAFKSSKSLLPKAVVHEAHRQQASANANLRRAKSPIKEHPKASDSGTHSNKGRTSLKPAAKDTLSPSSAKPPVSIKAGVAGRRTASASNRVSTLARHYERLNREVERERQRRLALARGKRARPVAVARPVVQVFDNVRDAVKEDSDDAASESSEAADDEYEGEGEGEDEDSRTPTLKTPKEVVGGGSGGEELSNVQYGKDSALREEPQSAAEVETPSVSGSPYPSLIGGSDTLGVAKLSHLSESEMSSSGPERQSLMRTITKLWAYRGAEWKPLDYPTCASASFRFMLATLTLKLVSFRTLSEHIFENNPVILREDEPSSIIAFTLRQVF
jgi:1-phosphatidylinositol-3-phosphate 5-kinase